MLGIYTIEKNGEVICDQKNIITDGGITLLSGLLADNLDMNIAKIGFLAVGIGDTAPSFSDTQLENELFRKEVSWSLKDNAVIEFVSFFGKQEAIGLWREVGLFNQASSGILISRATIPPLTKSNDDEISYKYSLYLRGIE